MNQLAITWHWVQAVARIEWRELKRNPMRQAMVACLVAIPVVCLVAASNTVFIIEPSPEEYATRALGRADIRWDFDDPQSIDSIAAAAGAECEVAPLELNSTSIVLEGRRLRIPIYQISESTLHGGMFAFTRGKFPIAFSEVALSTTLSRQLEADVGDQVVIGGRTCDVSGIVEWPEYLNQANAIQPIDLSGKASTFLIAQRTKGYSVPPPPRDTAPEVLTRADHATFFSDLDGVSMLALFGFGEAALVIGAASTVGLRRRQRESGLLAASGGTPFQILFGSLFSVLLVAVSASIVAILIGIFVSWMTHHGWMNGKGGDVVHLRSVGTGMVLRWFSVWRLPCLPLSYLRSSRQDSRYCWPSAVVARRQVDLVAGHSPVVSSRLLVSA